MKEVKRDQVIEAARKLFHQFGFKKVSMDEIAKEAGVTKKTIYMYFESKDCKWSNLRNIAIQKTSRLFKHNSKRSRMAKKSNNNR